MAKYRHRIFEMYENRDEAISALMPKSAAVVAATPLAALPSRFNHLTISRSAFVAHVRFKGTTVFTDETEADLREELLRLADELDIDSKVLLDFAGVELFSPACVEALAAFNRKLRNRGSRAVLCSLAPDTRACFYEPR